jgi:hypothetical protein
MMTEHRVEDRSPPSWPWLCRAPLLIAAALICLISGLNLGRLVLAQSPRDPWESIEVMEAWRSLRGMPVYELTADGHSTHMYGALVPWIQGEIFRKVGPNNISGRLLSLTSALLLVALLAVTMRGKRSAWYLAVAGAMILGVNHRAGQYFAENRPDMPALLFAAVALLLMGYGQEKRRGSLVILGSACLIVGFFLKQTVTIFATVPMIALILRGRRPTRPEILRALIPLAACGGTILGLKLLNPTVYHYMIDVPRSYSINWPRAASITWIFLIESPLFLILFGDWIISGEGTRRGSPRLLWLLSALAVAIPFSAVSVAKVGGWYNCWLPALLSMMAFCVLRLPVFLGRLEDPASPLRSRFLTGSFLAALLLMTTFPLVTKKLVEPVPAWDASYGEVVAMAARLPGTVICPEEPTIPLYAKGHAGRNIYGEEDARPVNGAGPTSIPEPVQVELRGADYVIDVAATEGWHDPIHAHQLRDLGFEPAEHLPAVSASYRFWRRKTIHPAKDPGRVAFRGESESNPDRPLPQ